MKKRISLKMFLYVVLESIWQVLAAIGGFFGVRKSHELLRGFVGALVIGAVWSLCTYLPDLVDYVDNHFCGYYAYHAWDYDKPLSERYVYVNRSNAPGYIRDDLTGKKVLDDVVWLRFSSYCDSIVVFKSKNGKRGYFNVNTGSLQVPAQFDKAWIFSEGLASVQRDGEIFFIDTEGNRAFPTSLTYPRIVEAYVFHGQHCAVEDSLHRVGLIDTKGQWVLPAEYDLVDNYAADYWIAYHGGDCGILSDSLTWILPMGYHNIDMADDGFFASRDGCRKRYDKQGRVVEDFVVTSVRRPDYYSDELDNEGNNIRRDANCLIYGIDTYEEGLMTLSGHPITKAIYNDIYAISADLYMAELQSGENVLIDSRGNVVTRTPEP